MSENKEEIWNVLKFYYKKRKNTNQIAKRICDVYGQMQYQYVVASNVFNL